MRADAIPTSVPATSVTGAIRQAARLTGTSFDYLLATAQVESGFNPNSAASTSSARGLFQFIEQTWLATLKQAGPQLGYGRYADAITRTAGGKYVVADPQLRGDILRLRNDPAANALMAGAFTNGNAAKLNAKLGRAASEGELYIAHFLGSGGAGKLIAAAGTNPQASAAAMFPGAARANRSIFYDKQGEARSVADVYRVLVGRYDVARAGPAIPTTVAAAIPDTAAMADAFAAANPPALRGDPAAAFHSLFQGGERREAIAPAVTELWTGQGDASPVQPTPAAQPAGDQLPRAQHAADHATFDLFGDMPADASRIFTTGS
jgi:Transglycosylase SLT domain